MKNSRNLTNSPVSMAARSASTFNEQKHSEYGKNSRQKKAYSTLSHDKSGMSWKLNSGSRSATNMNIRSTNGYAVSKLKESQKSNLNSSFYNKMEKLVLTKEQRQEIL